MKGGRAFTIALLVLAGSLLLQTVGLGVVARRVALPVSAIVTLLLVLQLFRESRTPSPKQSTDVEPGSESVAGPGSGAGPAIIWVLALPAAILLAGLYAGTGVFVLGFMRFRGHESWRVATVATALVVGGLWWIVGGLLGATPPTAVLLLPF